MESLHYTQYTAPKIPVVFLHGYCESSTIWHTTAEHLAKEHDIICPDLPGFGQSPALEIPFSLEDMAEEVYALLSDLEVRRCILIGHSMGGYVSLAFAQQYPEMLAGLGLFHSTAFADAEERLKMRQKAATFIQEQGTEKFVSSLMPSLFASPNKDRLREKITALVEEASRIKKEVAAAAMDAMRERPDRSALISQLHIPILYIIGEEDMTIPVHQSLQECFLANDSTLIALEKTGHMGMFESPQTVEKRLHEFITYCKR